MADYKAEYEREKKAREKAESLLGEYSRDLNLANKQLICQIKKTYSETEQKSLLLNVFRYSQESLSLKDLLPDVVRGMLSLGGLSFGLFEYFPIKRSKPNFRSNVFLNKSFHKVKNKNIILKKSLEARLIGLVADDISVQVIHDQKAIFVHDLKSAVNKEALTFLEDFGVTSLLALPIVVNNHTAAIIFLFYGLDDSGESDLLSLYESTSKQLGIAIEHRYNQDELEDNYYQLKGMVNELKVAQRQLVQSEKMASIGQLSAGIAHEINNPIGFVKSNVHTLREYFNNYHVSFELTKKLIDQLRSDSDVGSISCIDYIDLHWKEKDFPFMINDVACLIDETQHGIDRIVSIVSGLKKFSRTTDEELEDCSINDCVEEALKLCHNELKYKSTVTKNLQDVPLVYGNSGELVQVILNLLINAGHAITSEGEIEIDSYAIDDGVSIMIKDNGCGIEEQVINHIFDPFYTTKPIGTGTGLGLSISFGIIENHHGKLSVESVLGQGTHFNEWLPAKSS